MWCDPRRVFSVPNMIKRRQGPKLWVCGHPEPGAELGVLSIRIVPSQNESIVFQTFEMNRQLTINGQNASKFPVWVRRTTNNIKQLEGLTVN